MENQRQKWVNIVFLSVALLVAAVSFVALEKIVATYNLESSFKQIDIAVRMSSIVLGAVTGLFLYLNDKTNAFMNEVVLELARVTWPAPSDSMKATVFVFFFLFIACMILAAFDSLWSWVMKLIL